MLHRNEHAFVEQAMVGNPRSFRELVGHFQGFVYSVAWRFTGNSAESEDLTQEAFIRLWKSRERYDKSLPMKAWLGKIITNLCLDYLKSSKRRHLSGLLSDDSMSHVEGYQNPVRELESKELHALLISLSKKLTPKQQAVFVLRDLEAFEVHEVCEMLELSSDQVKSNLYHARIAIKSQLLKIYNHSKYEL
jgi:RNA polymerase sigma-70 factor (ECF subfamily)